MRVMARPLGLLTLTAALLVLAFGASPARAAFGVEEWQALTCKENVDTGWPESEELPLPHVPGQCTAETGDPENEARWFTQAAGHPNWGITDFTLNTFPELSGAEGFPQGFVKDTIVDTPEGLSVNPEATPKCTVEQLSTVKEIVPPLFIPECPPESRVGTNYFTVATEAPEPTCFPCKQARIPIPVFNVVPFQGSPSMVGFLTSSGPTFVVGSLDPEDQHVIFTISDIHEPPAGPPVVGSRLVFDGQAGNGTYLTNPSVCGAPQTATLHVDSHEGESDAASSTTPFGGEGCDKVPFDPTIETTVDSATDSPEPVTLDLGIPFDPEQPIANSYLRKATITLPEGAGLNPSLANGLETCTDAQFGYHTNNPIQCPPASKIGTTEVQTPSLPPDSLDGTVYAAEPLNQNPSSGEQFRIFLNIGSERYGVNVRLIGHVFPNLQTGQLTAVVDENPQATFRSFKVHIDGGPRGALTTPGTCGPHTTTSNLEPWTGSGDARPSSQFSLTTTPGRGPCAPTLADRPFNPGYIAGPEAATAGAFSPFRLLLRRPDGAQEIRQVRANLPPGMIASLKGVAYCPEANIAAAANKSGAAEIAAPSCPASSLVGGVALAAGSGPAPFHTTGKAYLAGPYKGAPVSMLFVTPAVAGPFDLGTVVVRAALNVDPETAEIHAVSDPIPYVFGGVKLDVRAIDVRLARPSFTVNPTTCRRPFLVGGDIFGGGSNPASAASWFESRKGNPFQATNCRALKFKPKFYARIFGSKKKTKRRAHPRFRAILKARKGDANLRRAAFILPRATILDQSHIRTVCTRVQLAASKCPKASIYGSAKATSPLLDEPLKGPVYLTSSDNELPDLLADLRGQVPIQLRGVISSRGARLKTVFEKTPDVAVDKFILNMKGGGRGLLVNSRDLCSRQTTGYLNLRAQNSRRMKSKNLRLNIPACRRGGG
jgi:hypothetical protein